MSIEELTRELAENREKVQVRDKARRDMDHVRESLQEEYKRRYALAEVLKKELRDVERMGGLSLTGLIYEFFGNKEEHMDNERQEQLAAKLKLDQCSHVISELERELSELERRLSNLEGLDERYESLFKEKEQLLLQSSNPNAHTLVALAEKSGTLMATQTELLDAIKAGESIRTSLSCVIDALMKAQNCSPGQVSSIWREHAYIDDARFHIRLAQANAKRFLKEMTNLNLNLSMNTAVEFGPLIKFTEYFFNNPITGWIVGSRIMESKTSAESALSQVRQALSELQRRLVDTQREIDESAEQRRCVIEHA